MAVTEELTPKQIKEQRKQMDINFKETGACGTFPPVNHSGQNPSINLSIEERIAVIEHKLLRNGIL